MACSASVKCPQHWPVPAEPVGSQLHCGPRGGPGWAWKIELSDMRRQKITFAVAILLVFVGVGPSVAAGVPSTQPFPGVRYRQVTRAEPPLRFFVVRVDLAQPGVHVRVAPGGPDPDGPGEWETTLMTPTSIAAREKFDLVVNGDFFSIAKDEETGKSPGYRPEVWAGAVGPAVTDGKVWSSSHEKRPCLIVRWNRRAGIELVDRPPRDAWAVVAGNTLLVEAGQAVPHRNKDRHPRTVVGLDRKGAILTILVVDGRRPGVSVGMSYEELAREMIRLGCWQAVNLDGGGSTVLAIRDPKGGYRILNTPSDGRERPVANVLGIRITPASHPTPVKSAGRKD